MITKPYSAALCVLFFSFSIFFFSCKKESSSGPVASSDEEYFKQQISDLVTLKKITNPKDTALAKLQLRFTTYKEAYQFFYKMFKTDAIKGQVHKDTLLPEKRSNQRILEEPPPTDIPGENNGSYYIYAGYPYTFGSISHTGGLIQVGIWYFLRITIYAWADGPGYYIRVHGNEPATPNLTYSGPGTITSSNAFINPTYPHLSDGIYDASRTGTFNGFQQGSVVIAGTALSFSVNLTGEYEFPRPTYPGAPTISVTSRIINLW